MNDRFKVEHFAGSERHTQSDVIGSGITVVIYYKVMLVLEAVT